MQKLWRSEKAVQSERLAAINTLNDSVKKLEASQNGGITDKIDTVMLTELNAISQSNMGLTAAELKAVGQRVLASLVPLVSLTTGIDRQKQLIDGAEGFIYAVAPGTIALFYMGDYR